MKYRIKQEMYIDRKPLFIIQTRVLFVWRNVQWYSTKDGFFYYFKTLPSAKKAIKENVFEYKPYKVIIHLL